MKLVDILSIKTQLQQICGVKGFSLCANEVNEGSYHYKHGGPDFLTLMFSEEIQFSDCR